MDAVAGKGLAAAPVPRLAPPAERWNPALALLSLASTVALGSLPFLKAAPNRLLSGQPVCLTELLLSGAALQTRLLAAGCALLLLALLGLSMLRPARRVLTLVVAAAAGLVPGWLAVAASQAAFIAETGSAIARTSLGSAFWIALLLAGLTAADALQRLRATGPVRLLVLAVIGLPVGLMLAMGGCDELSIMKEYANRADVFGGVVLRHLQIVSISLALTLLIGLPLGWAAHRHRRVGGSLFPVLNIIQTIPSIALFGLLMAPLAWLAASWPSLGRAGISGVGLAPGVIALVLYSLLPVVRGVLAGLDDVPSSVTEAARGLGMPAGLVFWQVELPLALPVVLGGIRTAAIQAVGLAAVTALIGAGGLGAIMFEGLFSNAQDLVLLGVLPVIAIGAAVDLAFKALIALARARSRGHPAAPLPVFAPLTPPPSPDAEAVP
ncbi:MAG: ABC transporter permease [Polaromonas sp.]|nr:ABC transporter permease [Polaromonas sp.]